MKNNELKSQLENYLDILKRNLAVVSLEELKTTYKKPFEQLQKNIAAAINAYVKDIIFQDLRFRDDYMDEVQTIIQSAIHQSELRQQISAAANERQDIAEIDRLALELKKQVRQALAPFYSRHLCLYLTKDCLDSPGQFPEYYNEATGCAWRNDTWVPVDVAANAILLPIREMPDLAA